MSRTLAANPSPHTNARVREQLALDLDALLADLVGAHESWLGHLEAHRQAVRRADTVAMQRALDAQRAALTRVAELDQTRRALVDRAAVLPELASTPAPRRGPITLREIASLAPEPARARLTERAESLRDLIGRVQNEGSTLHAASASLLAHMEGLMRQVARRLSQAGTYGRRGCVEPAPSMACALDLVH